MSGTNFPTQPTPVLSVPAPKEPARPDKLAEAQKKNAEDAKSRSAESAHLDSAQRVKTTLSKIGDRARACINLANRLRELVAKINPAYQQAVAKARQLTQKTQQTAGAPESHKASHTPPAQPNAETPKTATVSAVPAAHEAAQADQTRADAQHADTALPLPRAELEGLKQEVVQLTQQIRQTNPEAVKAVLKDVPPEMLKQLDAAFEAVQSADKNLLNGADQILTVLTFLTQNPELVTGEQMVMLREVVATIQEMMKAIQSQQPEAAQGDGSKTTQQTSKPEQPETGPKSPEPQRRADAPRTPSAPTAKTGTTPSTPRGADGPTPEKPRTLSEAKDGVKCFVTSGSQDPGQHETSTGAVAVLATLSASLPANVCAQTVTVAATAAVAATYVASETKMARADGGGKKQLVFKRGGGQGGKEGSSGECRLSEMRGGCASFKTV